MNHILGFSNRIGRGANFRSRHRLFASRQSFGWWVAVVIGMSVVTTMLTWSHYGRYSIPIRPLIQVGSAIGTFAFWRIVLGLPSER
jgi:hypothetical protein